MVYATWKSELDAFEAECDRLRKARRESFPVKVLGLSPLAGLLFLGSMPPISAAIALLGMAVSGISLLMELDHQREVYGGNLALDLNPNSDYDNLASAFRTRSPRWEALAYLYSQLDPITLKDRLTHLDDGRAKRTLDRMIRRVSEGVSEIKAVPSHRANYLEILQEISLEWKDDVCRILDKALFSAGVATAEDVDLDDGELGAIAPTSDAANMGESIAFEPLQQGFRGSDTLPKIRQVSALESEQMADRIKGLLEMMAEDGFPLGTLINHPFVWCWGRSQSGKTTIALLLAIARLAMGQQISYFTTDDDYPRNMPWDRVEDSPEGYAVALDDVRDEISTASKGALKGTGWIFDEMFAASAEHSIAIQPLLTCILMKGAKTRCGLIGISQADTSSAHGLKGIDAAWRIERVSVEAIHHEDAMGDRFPTGRYRVSRGDAAEEWEIPQWMLTERNEWGQFDPVVWMLKQFPELTGENPLTQSEQGSEDSEQWEAWLEKNSSFPKLLTGWSASPDAKRLLGWMMKRHESTGKSSFTLNELATGRPLGKNASHSAEVLQPLISELIMGNLIRSDGKTIALLNL